MEFVLEDAIKLLLAVLIGGVIGAEREFRDKSAGFRTIIFITIGSTLFTIFSKTIGINNDPGRIAANIVTGIGFLGAGAIMREGGRIAGLTTAATIWLAASLGMGIGAGEYVLVGFGTLLILAVLWLFPYFERWIDNIRETRTYEIVVPLGSQLVESLAGLCQEHKVRVLTQTEHKTGENILLSLYSIGRPVNHKKLVKDLMRIDEIRELRY
jgi:putative Mg2+ transporter-C (MgtC) family protein